VGSTGDANETLVESWNGTSWSVVTSPDPGAGANLLYGVSCTGATSCEAVGDDQPVVDGDSETLVESWNGTSWSVATSPNQGSDDNFLSGVSCPSATSCQAVGVYDNGSVDQTLVESWNGTSWSIAASPDQPDAANQLEAVSCAGPASCTAVGYDQSGSVDQTLIESWNGTSWTIASSPDQGVSDNYLYGVSCTSTTSCVAAGYDLNASVGDTLIEMPPPPVVSEVSPDTGYTTGTNTVTITGSGFTGATGVDFGPGDAGTLDTVSGDTSLTVTVPPGSAGVVDVTVTAPGGLSRTTPADAYTYTVDQTSPNPESCTPTCTANTVTTPLDQTSITVAGSAGTGHSGTTDLLVDTSTLNCGSSATANYDYATAVSELSTSGSFGTGEDLTVTEEVGDEPSATGVKVCYASGTDPTAGTLLRSCSASVHAPCVKSLKEIAGHMVKAKFLSPAGDPRFWTGAAAVDLSAFSPTKGKPGSTLTITGKNLTQVEAVVIGGAQAAINAKKSSATKVVVTIPTTAVTGLITVTSASGVATSTKTFKVT
jgi:hypothetical protein